MGGKLSAIALAVGITFGAGHVEAQVVDQSAELAAIDEEAAWATGLYVAAPILMAGGVGMVFGGYFADSAGVIILGLILAPVGLLTFIPAIVLDVDSGLRRDRLARAGRLELRFTGGAGSGGLSLSGYF